ncbi:hypothetical protein AVEN_245573-1 [Araneus ventricosus]|uniref:Uncharacterized protein n=1 Tax=Araneus ventricosus TaxID=182803 RepID=A0A4Y2H137_ARAVE|nr:hypothetical protein AVEN_245573-1 [Araneus ventricosus]
MQWLFWRRFTSSARWRYRLGLAELAASLLVQYPRVGVRRITSMTIAEEYFCESTQILIHGEAYIPESDVKFYHGDLPCGTHLNRKPRSHEPNLSEDARSTRSAVPRPIH